jgi:hypothetical protein
MAPRTLSIDDLFKVKVITDLRLSPGPSKAGFVRRRAV